MKRERDVDIEHAEAVQRAIDERALEDAYMEGQRAGLAGHSAASNPWADTYSQEFKRWEAGRAAGELARIGSRRAA